MLAFAGLIEGAPISYEDMTKAWDVAGHHHVRFVIDHKFNGDDEAYLKAVQDGSYRESYFEPMDEEADGRQRSQLHHLYGPSGEPL